MYMCSQSFRIRQNFNYKKILEIFPQVELSVSVTSRILREGEVDGKDYFSISINEFQKKIINKEFIEFVTPNISQSKHYYGTLFSEVKRISEKNKILIFDLDLKGLINMRKRFAEKSLNIYITSTELNRIRRLIGRGGSTDPRDLLTRIKTGSYQDKRALKEFNFGLNIDHICENREGKLEFLVKEITEKIKKFLSN